VDFRLVCEDWPSRSKKIKLLLKWCFFYIIRLDIY
jgi:hypothetical protein